MAYGPVFFNGDYALLQVTAYSKVPGQVIQGAELEVLVNPPAYPNSFTGTINYQDPTTETVTVTTGADGTANLIFRPTKNYGFYIPTAAAAGGLAGLATTTLANDTIVLPQPVAISQLYSAGDTAPWLVTLYIQVPSSPRTTYFSHARGRTGASLPGSPGPYICRDLCRAYPAIRPSRAARPLLRRPSLFGIVSVYPLLSARSSGLKVRFMGRCFSAVRVRATMITLPFPEGKEPTVVVAPAQPKSAPTIGRAKSHKKPGEHMFPNRALRVIDQLTGKSAALLYRNLLLLHRCTRTYLPN